MKKSELERIKQVKESIATAWNELGELASDSKIKYNDIKNINYNLYDAKLKLTAIINENRK